MTATPVLPQTPKITPQTIAAADTTSLKTLCTAGANGSKVIAVNVTSDDTAAKVIRIGITRSGTFYPLGSYSVPLSTGLAGVTSIDLLALVRSLPYDADGCRFIYLQSGDTLQAMAEATLTAGKTMNVVTQSEDF